MRSGAGDFELGESDVHVWVVPLDDPAKARRRELAHRAERRILARYLGIDACAVAFERGHYGKPRLADGRLEFNLSHSGPWALLAVSRHVELGIDVQGPHASAAKPWFAARICTPRELAALGPNPDPSQLLRLWARKEAVIKARGDLTYVSAGELDVLEDAVDGGWRCLDLSLPELGSDHHAAIALDARADVVIEHRSYQGTDARSILS